MIKSLADELSLRLVINKIIPLEKRKYYIYGIELILNDLLIFFMIICIALITKTFITSFLFSFSFCLLRTYAGGYHSKSYTRCFATAMFNYLTFLILNSILREQRLYAGIVMLVISIPIIWKLSPVMHENHPYSNAEKEKYKKISRKLTIIVSLLFIVSVIFLSSQIVFTLAWSMFATSFLMLLAIILNTKEETK